MLYNSLILFDYLNVRFDDKNAGFIATQRSNKTNAKLKKMYYSKSVWNAGKYVPRFFSYWDELHWQIANSDRSGSRSIGSDSCEQPDVAKKAFISLTRCKNVVMVGNFNLNEAHDFTPVNIILEVLWRVTFLAGSRGPSVRWNRAHCKYKSSGPAPKGVGSTIKDCESMYLGLQISSKW